MPGMSATRFVEAAGPDRLVDLSFAGVQPGDRFRAHVSASGVIRLTPATSGHRQWPCEDWSREKGHPPHEFTNVQHEQAICPGWPLPPTAYYRHRDGKMVHRITCRHAVGGGPWQYAAGFTADDIVTALASHPWLHACRVCRPDREDSQ